VDVGGYSLSYTCQGQGSPTVILEAGLGSAGTSDFFGFMQLLDVDTRVCTHDPRRHGDERPRVRLR
jgi:hypothetical protein